jgi:hypothetical protein
MHGILEKSKWTKKIFNGIEKIWNGLFFGSRIVKVKMKPNQTINSDEKRSTTQAKHFIVKFK